LLPQYCLILSDANLYQMMDDVKMTGADGHEQWCCTIVPDLTLVSTNFHQMLHHFKMTLAGVLHHHSWFDLCWRQLPRKS
jgi:hypothetical protein